MSGLKAVIDILKADAGVIAIAGDRIFPVHLPTAARPPAIVVHRVASTESYLIQNAGGYPRETISVESLATSEETAENLRLAVIEALKDFNGTIGALNVKCIKDGTDVTDASEEYGTSRRITDFGVWVR